MARIICILYLLLTGILSRAQIMPAERSSLNYRLVGFSFPCADQGAGCSIEIARGSFDTASQFDKNIVLKQECSSGKAIIEVPAFGCEYTWRTVFARRQDTVKSGLFHFSVTGSISADTSNSRVRVVKNTGEYKDNYFFVDATSTLYDMDGNPVWYLHHKNETVRDLKVSQQGTITCEIAENAIEVNYNGDTLWHGPEKVTVSGDTSEHYHHEFTRLANGHYMVFGQEHVAWRLPFYKRDPASKVYQHNIYKDSCGDYYEKLHFATLIEYNERGDVVWHWKSSEFFSTTSLYTTTAADGSFKVNDVHQNSFFFDEQRNVIYISCRDLSTILKVKYPEGTVLETYGPMCKANAGDGEKMLFNGQHSCKLSKDGYIYLYNNNSCQRNDTPSIVVLKEPGSRHRGLQKAWEYKCADETLDVFTPMSFVAREKSVPGLSTLTSGGNVMELPDGSLFVSMGEPFGKLFIVDKEKNVHWRATLEARDDKKKTWTRLQTYRATIISRSQLEQLIWNTQCVEKKHPML